MLKSRRSRLRSESLVAKPGHTRTSATRRANPNGCDSHEGVDRGEAVHVRTKCRRVPRRGKCPARLSRKPASAHSADRLAGRCTTREDSPSHPHRASKKSARGAERLHPTKLSGQESSAVVGYSEVGRPSSPFNGIGRYYQFASLDRRVQSGAPQPLEPAPKRRWKTGSACGLTQFGGISPRNRLATARAAASPMRSMLSSVMPATCGVISTC